MEYSNTSEVNDNEPRLCPKCQSFFGTKDTNFMCSKCFKESKAEAPVDKKDSIEMYSQVTQQTGKEPLNDVRERIESDLTADDDKIKEPEEKKDDAKPPEKPKVSINSNFHGDIGKKTSPGSHATVIQKKNRCQYWNKKTGLLGIECKCGYNFWSKHRHADDHNCEYNYKDETKAKLEQENPLVAPSKFGRI